MKAAPASVPTAAAKGLVGLPADELSDLLDTILAGDAEEDTDSYCPPPSPPANDEFLLLDMEVEAPEELPPPPDEPPSVLHAPVDPVQDDDALVLDDSMAVDTPLPIAMAEQCDETTFILDDGMAVRIVEPTEIEAPDAEDSAVGLEPIAPVRTRSLRVLSAFGVDSGKSITGTPSAIPDAPTPAAEAPAHDALDNPVPGTVPEAQEGFDHEDTKSAVEPEPISPPPDDDALVLDDSMVLADPAPAEIPEAQEDSNHEDTKSAVGLEPESPPPDDDALVLDDSMVLADPAPAEAAEGTTPVRTRSLGGLGALVVNSWKSITGTPSAIPDAPTPAAEAPGTVPETQEGFNHEDTKSAVGPEPISPPPDDDALVLDDSMEIVEPAPAEIPEAQEDSNHEDTKSAVGLEPESPPPDDDALVLDDSMAVADPAPAEAAEGTTPVRTRSLRVLSAFVVDSGKSITGTPSAIPDALTPAAGAPAHDALDDPAPGTVPEAQEGFDHEDTKSAVEPEPISPPPDDDALVLDDSMEVADPAPAEAPKVQEDSNHEDTTSAVGLEPASPPPDDDALAPGATPEGTTPVRTRSLGGLGALVVNSWKAITGTPSAIPDAPTSTAETPAQDTLDDPAPGTVPEGFNHEGTKSAVGPEPISPPPDDDALVLDDSMEIVEPAPAEAAEGTTPVRTRSLRVLSAFVVDSGKSITGTPSAIPDALTPAAGAPAHDALDDPAPGTVPETQEGFDHEDTKSAVGPEPISPPPDDDALVLDDSMEVADPAPAEAPEVQEDSNHEDTTSAVGLEPVSPPPDDDALVLDDSMEIVEPAPAEIPEAQEDSNHEDTKSAVGLEPDSPSLDDDALVLDDSMAVAIIDEGLADAPESDATGEEAPLVLDEAMIEGAEADLTFLAGLPPYEPAPEGEIDPLLEEPAEPAPAPEQEAVPEPEPVGVSTSSLTERIDAILLAESDRLGGDAVAGLQGDDRLPDNLDALAALLADIPPAKDFAALDLLYACWPKNTSRSHSRALLAVATNLAGTFGLPHRLPMAMSKAWRMLDPEIFEAELAGRLAATADFIVSWQREQKIFLILEFGEIELIEYLFEALPPGRHLGLLAAVMNFKVLSNRRMGLVRRIPTRVRKQIQPLLPERKEDALILLAHTKALLEAIATPGGFAPIVEAGAKAIEELDKLMKQTAAAGTAPPGGGQSLGRIG